MTTLRIPLTTYLIRSNKNTRRFGSPASLFISDISGNMGVVLARVPLDRIPLDASISSAEVRLYSDRDYTAAKQIQVRPITSSWRSRVTWKDRPNAGAILDSIAPVVPGNEGHLWALDVTTWAQSRSRLGLWIETDGTETAHRVHGSSASDDKPVLVVEYTVAPLTPSDLVPDGGVVSVPQPILSYAGDDDMTQQRIEYSADGITPSYDSGWLPASRGYFEPTGVEPVLTDGGAGIYWRATTDGPNGQSTSSEWAYYEYASLPTVTITDPGAVTDDGTPYTAWTVEAERQVAWRGTLEQGSTLKDETAWADDPAAREWTPAKGVGVPDKTGRITIEVRDDVADRVDAVNAPTTAKAIHEFVTSLAGTEVPVDSLNFTWDEPVATFTGSRAIGVPDEIMLVRDGEQVPLWSPVDEEVYPGWAPAADFFTGTDFEVHDYTVPPRGEHTWEVKVRQGGTVSDDGPTVTETIRSGCVWLLDPRTGDRIEIQGYNGLPVVEQSTAEMSVLHTPVNGGLLVESTRRRLVRTTRAGSVEGVIVGAHEALLEGWVEDDSSLRYRLIFGKVNWPVIIGDYDPFEVFYSDNCEPGMVRVALNWWQRLTD